MKTGVLKKFILIFVICLVSAACARIAENEDNSYYSRALLSWVKVNFPGAVSTVSESGVYTLESFEGTGARPTDSQYVFVHYTKRNLEGIVLDTNEKDIAERTMTFDKVAFYGPDTWVLGSDAVPAGINETLRGMRVGGKVKVAVPKEALSVENTVYHAFTASGTDNAVYDLVVEDVVSDINEFQLDSMFRFRDHNFPGLDTMVTGFFFKKIGNSGTDAAKDTIGDETTLKVRYIGRLLDGHVFDTNIADTAKKYGFYNDAKTYDALEVKYNKELKTMLDGAGTVEGFTRAVHEMNYGDYAITFFWSDMGYKQVGSSNSIPEYSPLFFQLWLEEED